MEDGERHEEVEKSPTKSTFGKKVMISSAVLRSTKSNESTAIRDFDSLAKKCSYSARYVT